MIVGSRSHLSPLALIVGAVVGACGTPHFIVAGEDGGGVDSGALDGHTLTDAGSPPSDGRTGDADASPRLSGPTTLVSGELQPRGITVDPSRLFWVVADSADGTGAVRTFEKATSTVTTIADKQLQPLDIVVDSSNLYWSVATATPTTTAQCMAMKMLKPMGTAACLATGPLTTGRLALGGANVFLSGATNGTTRIGFVAATANDAPLAYILAETTDAVAGDGTDVFYGDGTHVDTDTLSPAGTALLPTQALCNTSCGMGTTVDIAVGPTGAVFWATTAGQVLTATPGPQAVTTMLGQVPAVAQRIAVDANYVYVTSSSASAAVGSVTAISVEPGGPVKTLSSTENAPFGITVDDNNVYWTCGNGTIRGTGIPL